MKRQLEVLKDNKGKTIIVTINESKNEVYILSTFVCETNNIPFKKNRYQIHLLSNLFTKKTIPFNLYEISEIQDLNGKILYSRKLHGARLAKLKDRTKRTL
jgi:hypothetical protein